MSEDLAELSELVEHFDEVRQCEDGLQFDQHEHSADIAASDYLRVECCSEVAFADQIVVVDDVQDNLVEGSVAVYTELHGIVLDWGNVDLQDAYRPFSKRMHLLFRNDLCVRKDPYDTFER